MADRVEWGHANDLKPYDFVCGGDGSFLVPKLALFKLPDRIAEPGHPPDQKKCCRSHNGSVADWLCKRSNQHISTEYWILANLCLLLYAHCEKYVMSSFRWPVCGLR